MTIPRAVALRSSIRSATTKRVGLQVQSNLRAVGRRTYASGHEVKKSSDLPWLIGSLVVTVPAAGWLWQQGPSGSPAKHDHGHVTHTDEGDEEDEEVEEKSADPEEDPKKDSDKSATGGPGGGTETEDNTAGSPPESGNTEKKGEKDEQGDVSSAKNPFLNDSQEPKGGQGVPATARIHGTVDSSKPVYQKGGADKSKDHNDNDTTKESGTDQNDADKD